MSTLVLLLLAGIVVAWVGRQAVGTDKRDETDRFSRVQHLVAGWTEDVAAAPTGAASRSCNDLAHSTEDPSGPSPRPV